MNVRYETTTRPSPEDAAGVRRLWAEVTNAGGAVGLVPPVGTGDVAPLWEEHERQLADGAAELILGRAAPTADAVPGPPVAVAFLRLNAHLLMRHWAWAYRVMLHPDLWGRGEGRRLMTAVADRGRERGLHGIRLTCRNGLGLERFYEACGYKEIGRAPAAIRVAEGEYRDETTFWLPLR
ncbi:GNAT family N-acetyltransferase [Streptomyces calidiresistens]|uniref:GNAT family N-acetyltransferase n=1 Tax=Streptomyces calidiresistens TaxID=1485586 RepID=A0A7W3XWW8_9ACTN|nr:GNAT family N-acetyltransferase [Streptomyces calidiresistens]MBB0230273.1 GNAT family N-acetyltransferase [Streptomyces calidiresistens]